LVSASTIEDKKLSPSEFPTKVTLYINNEKVEPSAGEYIVREDPAEKTRIIHTVAKAQKDDVGSAIDAARDAFDHNAGGWVTDYKLRERVLYKLGDLIRTHAASLAALESASTGKVIRISLKGDIPRTADLFEYYAGLAGKTVGQSQVLPNGDLISILKEPLGVVAAIAPWNFPLVILGRQVGPALAAGCTVVVKPSTLTPATALEIAKLIAQAGAPKGVFNLVTGPGGSTGTELVNSSKVDAIAFTGETNTGKSIMKSAASNLARVVLELGGKNPNVVFDDADIEAAANGVVYGGYANNGETCAAGSRLLVQESVHDRLVKAIVEKVARIKVGHPLDESSNMGPLVSESQESTVLGYVAQARDEGARVVAGGSKENGEKYAGGYYVQPTVIDEVSRDMKVFQDEIFGPVVTVSTFKDEVDAIEQANATIYGLAAGVWTRDTARAVRAATKIRAGTIWINTYYTIPVESPWGGYKQSGIGRGNSMLAIDDYLEVKSVYFDSSGKAMKSYFGAVLG
jgi:betaine-aldehyde dehydrogenase